MRHELTAQIIRINGEREIPALNPTQLLRVPVRHTEATSFIAYEPVKRNHPHGAEIITQRARPFHFPCGFHALPQVLLMRDTIYATMVSSVLCIAPAQSLIIQISDGSEHAPRHEVSLDKPNQALHGSFGEGMPRLTELRIKADRVHELLVFLVPERVPLRIPASYNAFHVVG